MSILEINNVSYGYSNKKQVLSNVNFTFEPGKFYAIVGNSGEGKTTLLSLLAGLDSPNKGEIRCNGENIEVRGDAYHRKHNISLVFQSYNLIEYMTALENLKLVSKDGKEEELISLGLTKEEIHKNVLRLSGGQQQRVAIGRSLVSKAPIILADEPTGNLDENTARDIINILKEVAKSENKCVIVVTHSPKLAASADVVLRLKNKKLIVEKS